MVRKTIEVKEHESLLVASSTLFTFAGFYGYCNGMWPYGLLSLVTTIVSINYWSDTRSQLKRNCDIVVAKGSFVIYFISGIMYVHDLSLLIVGISILLGIIYHYDMSFVMHHRGESSWVKYHAGFHLCVALEQYLVLYAGIQKGYKFS